MVQQDTLQRFLFEQAPVRGEIVHLDATWQAVLERHEYPMPLRTVLGELMAAAALLAATLKFSGALVMQMQGNGPVRLVVVECNSDMTMRATAKWAGELTGNSLAELLGEGRFSISIHTDEGKRNYQGVVELSGGSVAGMLENYMRHSEQLDTRLWLATSGNQAAGMLLQRLPGQRSEDTDAWDRATHLAATITPQELLGLPVAEIMHRLFHEEDLRLLESHAVRFSCSCSHERVADMLRMLGYDEVKSVLAEMGRVEVNCEFCNQHYTYDAVDAEQIFAAGIVTEAPRTIH
jgi:molecular chaperone Hsp33